MTGALRVKPEICVMELQTKLGPDPLYKSWLLQTFYIWTWTYVDTDACMSFK